MGTGQKVLLFIRVVFNLTDEKWCGRQRGHLLSRHGCPISSTRASQGVYGSVWCWWLRLLVAFWFPAWCVYKTGCDASRQGVVDLLCWHVPWHVPWDIKTSSKSVFVFGKELWNSPFAHENFSYPSVPGSEPSVQSYRLQNSAWDCARIPWILQVRSRLSTFSVKEPTKQTRLNERFCQSLSQVLLTFSSLLNSCAFPHKNLLSNWKCHLSVRNGAFNHSGGGLQNRPACNCLKHFFSSSILHAFS